EPQIFYADDDERRYKIIIYHKDLRPILCKQDTENPPLPI
ncbi:MAG: hypothetical protein RLZZ429_1333, partial [Bacteroidota bacterium]